MSKYKSVSQTTTPQQALENFYGDIAQLLEELWEVIESTTGRQKKIPRMATIKEAIGILEIVKRPVIPMLPQDLARKELHVIVATPRDRKQHTSREVRRDNAAAYAEKAVEAIREWINTHEEPDDELTMLIEFCDEVEGHIAEAKDAKMPGMYHANE